MFLVSWGGLAGPVCLDAADGLGGGAADRPHVVAAQFDGQGGVGDVDGDDLAGVRAAAHPLFERVRSAWPPTVKPKRERTMGLWRNQLVFAIFGWLQPNFSMAGNSQQWCLNAHLPGSFMQGFAKVWKKDRNANLFGEFLE